MTGSADQRHTHDVDAQSVRAYLRDHPDIVREDAELMALIAEQDAADGVVDPLDE